MMNKPADVDTMIFFDKQRILDELDSSLETAEEQKEYSFDGVGYIPIMLVGGAKNDKVKYIVRQWCKKHELHLLEVDCTALRIKTDRDDKEPMIIPGQIIKWPKSMIEGLEVPQTVIFLDGYDHDCTENMIIRRSLRNFTYEHTLYAPHEEHQKRRFDNLLMSIVAVDKPIYNYGLGDFDGFSRTDVFRQVSKSSVVSLKRTDNRRYLAPDECAWEMLSHIGDDGMLYIPEWPHGGIGVCSDTTYYACKMDQVATQEGYDKVKTLFDGLMEHFKHIADKYDEIGDDSEENTALLGEKTFLFWNMLVRPFEAKEQFDMERIGDILDRLDDCDEFGNCTLSDEEIAEFGDRTVSKDELALYEKYIDALYEEAKERIPGRVCSYEVLIRSMRVCKLMELEAPECIIQDEAAILAQALVLNMYCDSMEKVELVV